MGTLMPIGAVGVQVVLYGSLRELIINCVDIVASFDHFMALGTHFAHQTFQDVGCIGVDLLSRMTFP